MKKLKNTGAYAYLFPSFLIFGIFLFYPFFKTLYLSLFKTNKMGQAKLFVGLQNYIDLLSSKSFQNSLKVTVVFVLIVVVGGMLLGLVAAVLCNKAFPGIRVFSTAYALPMAIASSSAAMIFQIMLGKNTGNPLILDGDKYIPGMQRLTDAIHAEGAKCFLQLRDALREAGCNP